MTSPVVASINTFAVPPSGGLYINSHARMISSPVPSLGQLKRPTKMFVGQMPPLALLKYKN